MLSRFWPLNDFAAQLKARAAALRAASGTQLEEERIRDLPIFDTSERGEELAEKWTHSLRKHPNAPPLRPIQGIILEECHRSAEDGTDLGMLGQVAVGGGKTLAFHLIPVIMKCEDDHLLLLPPNLREPCNQSYWEWSEHYWMPAPQVLAYTQLSSPQASAVLRHHAPKLIMADEVHCLANKTAARTKRFERYMDGAGEDVRFVGMTGTLGSNLENYAHLSAYALGRRSPVPQDKHVLAKWSSVLDAGGEPDDKAWHSIGYLDENLRRSHNKADASKAYSDRLIRTPGFVLTQASSCDAELHLHAMRPPLSKYTQDLIAHVAEYWEIPHGDEIVDLVDALSYHSALQQLAMGFFYVWDWPDGEEDVEWMEARKAWSRQYRWYLARYAREQVDSPHLYAQYLKKEQAGSHAHKLLVAWETQRKLKPQPPTKAIWVDGGPVTHAYQWARQQTAALIWTDHRAVQDMLRDMGLPVYGQGDGFPQEDVCAVSTAIYHKGFNFQHRWHRQLVMCPRSSEKVWEQKLGRMHRSGQESDRVDTWVFQHTWKLREAMHRATQRATAAEGNLKQPQKLLHSEWHGFNFIPGR